jgi:hypothetical protein
LGKALITQPIQTGKAVLVDPIVNAFENPRAMGQFAGEFINPLRLASALRRGPMQELDVYHGTPHRFPETEANPLGEFDASKVGTGEGAQAYGHGIYLAESPEVAIDYKENLQTTDTLLNGKKVFPIDPAFSAATRISARGYDTALAETRRDMTSEFLTPQGREFAAKLHQQIQELKGAKIENVPSGSVYKADLPDEMIDRMLDWDKPLSEQSEAVRKAFAKADERARFGPLKKNAPILDPEEKHLRGQDAYRALANALSETGVIRRGSTAVDGSDKAVSEYLRQLGIPGVRYLDAGSRGKDGTGTRNFVVFPGEEKKVKILRRE